MKKNVHRQQTVEHSVPLSGAMLYVLGALVTLSVVTVGRVSGSCASLQCPAYPNGTCIDGNIPNPTDCGSFCQCSGCVPVKVFCPDGTHYHPDTDSCISTDQSTCYPSTIYTTTTPAPIGGNLTMFAVNQMEVFGSSEPIRYNQLVTNRGGYMDEVSYRLFIPGTGMYLVGMSAGAGGTTEVDFRLVRDFQNSRTIFRDSVSHLSHDTIGRETIMWFNFGEYIWTGTHSLRLYSDPAGLQTSWAVTSLTGELGVSDGFSVGKTNSYSPGLVTFDHVEANVGFGWIQENNYYQAPLSGAYYIMFSVGVPAVTQVDAYLTVGGVKTSNLLRQHTDHIGVDTMGRAMFLLLGAGQTVALRSDYGGYSDATMQTSLSGFRYDPAHGNALAWGAYRTSSWSDESNGLYPIPYTLINVNVGGGLINHRVSCIYSGYYYVNIGAGAMPGLAVDVTLVRSGVPLLKLSRADISHANVDTLSRSAVVECDPGQQLWLEAPAGTGLYSDVYLQTGFAGFFLHGR